jgi:glycosyltransferase involved in cell wall biosynthesis
VTITNSVALPLLIPRGRAGLIYMSIARFPKGQMSAYRRVDRMQTVSSHIGDAVRRQSPSVAHLVKTVPNALSKTFAGAMDEDRGARQKEILFVGRIAREKGIHLLVRAFKIAHATFPEWKLTIVGPHLALQGGDGEACLEELKTLAGHLGSSVDFIGPIFDETELVKRFKRCEVFVYPSIAARGEALPWAPVEAMACGCAVVVSSLDCFNDYLRDGTNGVVFNEVDESGTDLAAKLVTLMGNQALRDRIAVEAVQTARAYTRESVALAFLEDFNALRSAAGRNER